MNSEDVSISPLLAIFVGCFSAFIFALLIVFCKHYLAQIKKKQKFLGFVIEKTARQQRSSQRLDSAFENCEYCNCCKDNPQIPCNCGCNSNNNSNSADEGEIDSNNILIYNSNKLNESLLDAISVEKGVDVLKLNYIGQNSLDIASLDEIVNEDLLDELDKNIAVRLDENDNQSYEIIKQEEDTKSKQLGLNNEKPIKVVLKLKRNLPLKLHSQSIELINEKPSTKRLIPRLRRASLNITGNLVRQKSFDLFDEEDEDAGCQNLDSAVRERSDLESTSVNNNDYNNRKSNDKEKISRQSSEKENIGECKGEEKKAKKKNKSAEYKAKYSREKESTDEQSKEFALEDVESKKKANLNDNTNKSTGESMKMDDNQQDRQPDNDQLRLKSADSLSEENEDPKDYKGSDYKDLWSLRATLEAEVDKDLTDSCGDLSEISNLVKQRSTENTEEHELIKNIVQSSNSDPKLSKNDSGYKSIERRDYSIDSKSESIYRQFTGSSSLSKEFSLGSQSSQKKDFQVVGSISSQQNMSICSNSSINLDVKNYKNQYTIKEEEDAAGNDAKITFL